MRFGSVPPSTTVVETTTTIVQAGYREDWFTGTAFASGAVVALILLITIVLRSDGRG